MNGCFSSRTLTEINELIFIVDLDEMSIDRLGHELALIQVVLELTQLTLDRFHANR